MVCAPAVTNDAAKLAWIPVEPALRLALPNTVLPSSKVIAPVGVPPLAPLMVAVNVTDCPSATGSAETERAAKVSTFWTVSPRLDDVLELKVLSPS